MRIAVGGMIASGKSTLSEQLAGEYNLKLIEEFAGDNDVFKTLLDWLYSGKPNVEMLLQIYFLHNQWLKHKELGDDYVVDRDVIEHWIFAQTNLRKHPEVLNMYNGLFHAYMNSIKLPEIYVILEVGFEEFKSRVMMRGRPEEIENFDKNEQYFRDLLSNYSAMLRAQCVIYSIPYIVINTDNKTIEEIKNEAINEVNKYYVKNARK
jgi:deoxyadenosine/deoxycytidine kinase